ncbi:MAG: flagellar biosynthesis protein FlhF [Spirochaetia bacterium]|nr:flagellar biosynthesis protein FlhF [Spirochaetia bacterium]
MQYVKIIGDSHSDALKKLRDTYGSDAMVYNEKEIPATRVLSRLVGKKQFVIQAMLNEKKQSDKSSSGSYQRNNHAAGALGQRSSSSERLMEKIPVRVREAETEMVYPEKKKHAGAEFLALLEKEGVSESRKKFNLEDISLDKKGQNNINGEIEVQGQIIRESPRKEKTLMASSAITLDHLQNDLNEIKDKISILIKSPVYSENKNEIDRLKENLFEQEFTPHWITEFIQTLKQSVPQSDWNIGTKIYLKAKEVIASKVKVNSSMTSKRVIVLLGPTGVGKTTTVAKLAARLKLQENRKISLITLDNYRIAATEQLKVYGDIMDIPVFVIKEPEKFKKKIAEDTSDFILVDTTGFSHNNREFLMKQKAYFEGLEQEIDKHLVIAATSKIMDAGYVIEKFSEYGLNKIILSKIDETMQIGGFAELAEKWNLPFSFYTNGQRVPDDYLPADKNYLAEKILFRLKEKCMYTNS